MQTKSHSNESNASRRGILRLVRSRACYKCDPYRCKKMIPKEKWMPLNWWIVQNFKTTEAGERQERADATQIIGVTRGRCRCNSVLKSLRKEGKNSVSWWGVRVVIGNRNTKIHLYVIWGCAKLVLGPGCWVLGLGAGYVRRFAHSFLSSRSSDVAWGKTWLKRHTYSS